MWGKQETKNTTMNRFGISESLSRFGVAVLVIGVAAALGFLTAAQPAADRSRCFPSGTSRMLELSFEEFDQSAGRGWREGERYGCQLEAAELLRRYRAIHGGDMSAANRAGLAWHEAQQRALGGQTQQAAELIESDALFESEPAWSRLHKQATVAFLTRDEEGLRRLLSAYESLPREEQGPEPHITGAVPNLSRVRGLIECYSRTYAVAYACTGSPQGADANSLPSSVRTDPALAGENARS